MRVTSDLFVAQLIRRIFTAGGFGAVLRRGDGDAGAIFILARSRSGALVLHTPAVQSTKEMDDGLREFMREAVTDEAELTRRFEREARFDPDFWLVEIETDDASAFLSVVPDGQSAP